MTLKERVVYSAEMTFGFGMVVVLSTASCVFGRERVIRWVDKLRIKLNPITEEEKENVRKQKEEEGP